MVGLDAGNQNRKSAIFQSNENDRPKSDKNLATLTKKVAKKVANRPNRGNSNDNRNI